jgi:hypothetical protein
MKARKRERVSEMSFFVPFIRRLEEERRKESAKLFSEEEEAVY